MRGAQKTAHLASSIALRFSEISEGLSSAQMRETWFHLTDLMAEVNAEAEQVLHHLRERTDASFTGTDERRHIEVTVNASGSLSALTINDGWLNSVSTERLRETLRAAFAAAYDALDASHGPDAESTTPAGGPISRHGGRASQAAAVATRGEVMATSSYGSGSGAAIRRGAAPVTGVKLDLDKMMVDARRWREASEDLAAAKEVARGLDLTARDFSLLADQQGATETYRKVQDKLIRLLGEGEQVLTDIGDRLERVVRNAEETEQEHRERLERVEYLLEDL